MPRLKTEAKKPPISVTIPPPRFNTKSFLPKPYSEKAFQTCMQTSITLFSSPFGSKIISDFSRAGNDVMRYSRQRSCVFSSTTMIILLPLYNPNTSDKEESESDPISICVPSLEMFVILR